MNDAPRAGEVSALAFLDPYCLLGVGDTGGYVLVWPVRPSLVRNRPALRWRVMHALPHARPSLNVDAMPPPLEAVPGEAERDQPRGAASRSRGRMGGVLSDGAAPHPTPAPAPTDAPVGGPERGPVDTPAEQLPHSQLEQLQARQPDKLGRTVAVTAMAVLHATEQGQHDEPLPGLARGRLLLYCGTELGQVVVYDLTPAVLSLDFLPLESRLSPPESNSYNPYRSLERHHTAQDPDGAAQGGSVVDQLVEAEHQAREEPPLLPRGPPSAVRGPGAGRPLDSQDVRPARKPAGRARRRSCVHWGDTVSGSSRTPESDADDGVREVARWQAHREAVKTISVTENPQGLATSCTDGTVRLWSLSGALFGSLRTSDVKQVKDSEEEGEEGEGDAASRTRLATAGQGGDQSVSWADEQGGAVAGEEPGAPAEGAQPAPHPASPPGEGQEAGADTAQEPEPGSDPAPGGTNGGATTATKHDGDAFHDLAFQSWQFPADWTKRNRELREEAWELVKEIKSMVRGVWVKGDAAPARACALLIAWALPVSDLVRLLRRK